MELKKLFIFGGILFIIVIAFAATATLVMPGQIDTTIQTGKSIEFYLKNINSNIIGTYTQTAQIPITPPKGTGTSIIAKEQTLTAECIENILTKYDSPAKNIGLGEKILSQAKLYNIDAGYALATFRVESTFGKNGKAFDNNSIGNRRDEQGNFIAYNSWEEGITDWFSYINRKYVSKNITTVETIAPIYAPPVENNTAQYITDITGFMTQHKGMC